MKRVTREWVRKAEADHAAALRECKARAWDLTCFLAQQTIEKYLKAILEEHTAPFPRTHDLLHLGKLSTPFCPSLAPYLPRLRRASDYAVKFRYPGACATASQGRAAVALIREVRIVLREALKLG